MHIAQSIKLTLTSKDFRSEPGSLGMFARPGATYIPGIFYATNATYPTQLLGMLRTTVGINQINVHELKSSVAERNMSQLQHISKLSCRAFSGDYVHRETFEGVTCMFNKKSTLRPMPMETRSSKVFFPKISL